MDLATITLRAKVADPEEPALADISLVDGNFALAKPVISSGEEALPTTFSLSQNYPNPFNPTTTIHFGLPEAGNVRLAVYNVLGQEITSLVSGKMEAGTYKAVWNSLDNSGRRVSSGVYFYRLVVEGKVIATKKMLLLQ